MCLSKPVSQKAYDVIISKIADVSGALANASMTKDTTEEKINDDTANSIAVSGDGTWKTLGHTSHADWGYCNWSWLCEKSLVMSSHYRGCNSYKGSKLGLNYSAFFAKHQNFCKNNHYGTAVHIEVSGIKKIFFFKI
ncbi:hypothetical protein NPIL_557961 [Nephila pilipes]|uniref:Uncharacterized protein n=1 Tax=Nephila pilipes TaxID=299642 RepID=A0A8X6QKC4_NEPPI|nr:hypothetical protein NPIL_557961 [Nephila pilipes]